MIRKSYFGVFLTLLMFTAASSVHAHDDKETATTKSACEVEAEPLIHFDVEVPGSYIKLGKKGAERLQSAQIALQQVTANFNKVFESMANLLLVDFNAATLKQNVFHLGGPGGAKTGHLLWTFIDPWHIQMHEWRTDADIFGAPKKASLELGLIERNSKNSIVRKKFGIIDEATASTPAVFGALLSLLNPKERFFQDDNGQRAIAETRSIFLTGNATRQQMLASLWERLITTGPALLNRTIYKTWVPNWLADAEQERATALERKMEHWNSAIEIGSNAQKARAKELISEHSTREVDWDMLQQFATHAFVVSPELDKATLALANKFRLELAKHIHESYTNHATDPQKHPFILVPTAQMTERLRRVFEIAIRTSAMLDWIEMVGFDEVLKLKSAVVLKPSSLWRLSYILTTIGGGINLLDQSGPTSKVRFGLIRGVNGKLTQPDRKLLELGLGEPVEREEFKNMGLEQDWFNAIFGELAKPNPNDKTDIENAITRHKETRGY